MESYLVLFLNAALDEVVRLALHLLQRAPGTPYVENLLHARAGLDTFHTFAVAGERTRIP